MCEEINTHRQLVTLTMCVKRLYSQVVASTIYDVFV